MADCFALLGLGGKVATGISFGALGGCCFVGARYTLRVQAARRRLQDLIASATPAEARIVITGATSGIGEELAKHFLRHQSTWLLLGCRDVERAKRLVGGLANSSNVRIVPLELLDFDSVQSFADEAHEFLGSGSNGLRLLLNNAGVMRPRAPANESVDPTWQTNFLSPFLLTELLARRRGADDPPVKVVNVSSRLEKRSKLSKQLLEDAAAGKPSPKAYGDSKRAMMLWMSVRAKDLCSSGNMYVNATTPGMVDTQLGRNSMSPWLWPLTKPVRMLLLRSAAEGALGVSAAALGTDAPQSFGKYFDGNKELEDLIVGRKEEEQTALEIVEWASSVCALERRVASYTK